MTLVDKNCVTNIICENGDGSYSYNLSFSLVPEWNNHVTIKFGERTELQTPVHQFVTITKKSENVWINRVEMGGVVWVSDVVFHASGLTVTGTVEGHPGSFTEEFKKVSPKVTGFYQMESETGMFEITKAIVPGLTKEQFQTYLESQAFRLVENPDGIYTVNAIAGGKKEKFTYKLDEEFEYENATFGMKSKIVSTKIGPGAFKTIYKWTKDGSVTERTMNFTEGGLTDEVRRGGLVGRQVWRRCADLDGTWRCAAHTGMETYLDLMGVPADMKPAMLEQMDKDEVIGERMSGGKVKWTTNNPFFAEMNRIYEFNESYSFDTKMGKVSGVSTETGETVVNVMKFGTKTVTQTQNWTGDFMIAELVVNGCKNATAKTIFVRV